MQIAMKLQLPATVKKKGKYFISCCPVLDVCSQGETEKRALDNLVEAITLFLLSCFERGTLDDVLKERGFEPARQMVAKTKFSTRFKSIDIPIPFHIKRKEGGAQCHA